MIQALSRQPFSEFKIANLPAWLVAYHVKYSTMYIVWTNFTLDYAFYTAFAYHG
jgi:hypothetical protein